MCKSSNGRLVDEGVASSCTLVHDRYVKSNLWAVLRSFFGQPLRPLHPPSIAPDTIVYIGTASRIPQRSL